MQLIDPGPNKALRLRAILTIDVGLDSFTPIAPAGTPPPSKHPLGDLVVQAMLIGHTGRRRA